MTPELQALAVRCEQSSGPSLALERDIALAIYPGAQPVYANETRISVWDGNGRTQITVKPYTASLDAAMTLAPEGWDHLEVYCPRSGYPKWTVHIIGATRAMADIRTGYAPSYELALCAAALRAITPTQNHKGPHDE